MIIRSDLIQYIYIYIYIFEVTSTFKVKAKGILLAGFSISNS